jgi:hypothetical protein
MSVVPQFQANLTNERPSANQFIILVRLKLKYHRHEVGGIQISNDKYQ